MKKGTSTVLAAYKGTTPVNFYRGSTLVQHTIPNTIITVNYTNPILSTAFYWDGVQTGFKNFGNGFPRSFESEDNGVYMGTSDVKYAIFQGGNQNPICINNEGKEKTGFASWVEDSGPVVPDYVVTSMKQNAGINYFYLGGGDPEIERDFYRVLDPISQQYVWVDDLNGPGAQENFIIRYDNNSGSWRLKDAQEQYTYFTSSVDYFPFTWNLGGDGTALSNLTPYDIGLEQA